MAETTRIKVFWYAEGQDNETDESFELKKEKPTAYLEEEGFAVQLTFQFDKNGNHTKPFLS